MLKNAIRSKFLSQNISDGDYLMDNLWILEKKSGLCIFQKIFNKYVDKSKIPNDLITGFFSAIIRVFDEVFCDEIHQIRLHERNLYFKFTQELVFIACFNNSKGVSEAKMNKIISKTIHRFYQKFYDTILGFDNLNHISNFYSFSEDLEQLMEVKSCPLQLFNSI